jgi:hypothetical protein
MSQHPVNLAVRFFLEIAALVAMGYWGWRHADGLVRYGLTVGVPLVAATLWAVFRVPGDPGPAPVAVPGAARLALEAAFFGFAVWALYSSDVKKGALTLAIVVILHYAISTDRIGALLRGEQ